MTELYFFHNVTNCIASKFAVNEACISVKSAAEKDIQLWAQSEECYKCDYQPWCTVGALENVSFRVETRYPILLRYSFNGTKLCLRNFTFKEFGVYGWNISHNTCNELYVIKQPGPQFLPLIVAASLLLIVSILSCVFPFVVESRWCANLCRGWASSSETEKDPGRPNVGDVLPVMRNEEPQNKCQQKRVVSLDVFRGFCVALMIFVHSGGGHYSIFKHSIWNGITIPDVLFPWHVLSARLRGLTGDQQNINHMYAPCLSTYDLNVLFVERFMWIMGLGLEISLRSQLRSSKSRLRVVGQVLSRSFLLCAYGVFITNNAGDTPADIKELKVFGVLQTLGVCYMVIGIIESLLMPQDGALRHGRWIALSDILESWRQWLLVLASAGTHVGISLALPVPGCPRGYLGPGGWHMHGQYANCTAGAAGYIQRLMFSPKRRDHATYVYRCKHTYLYIGMFPNLTRILLVYLGVHAGRIMQYYNNMFMRLYRWLLWGLATGIIAGILCRFSKEDGIIPVNRYLSSVSFVLATASMAFIFFSVLYFVVDCRRWWSGAPFLYAGRNALLLYIGHTLLLRWFPFAWKPLYYNHAEYLALDMWNTTLWLIIAYFMHRRKCFLTL